LRRSLRNVSQCEIPANTVAMMPSKKRGETGCFEQLF
jgi:hypothetical protein